MPYIGYLIQDRIKTLGSVAHIMNSSTEKIHEKSTRMVFKICKGMYAYIYVKYNLTKNHH